MTPKEASKKLGYSKADYVCELIKLGKLKAKKIKTKPGDFGYNRYGYRFEISADQLKTYRKKYPVAGPGRPSVKERTERKYTTPMDEDELRKIRKLRLETKKAANRKRKSKSKKQQKR